jgi:hypothetical protein
MTIGASTCPVATTSALDVVLGVEGSEGTATAAGAALAISVVAALAISVDAALAASVVAALATTSVGWVSAEFSSAALAEVRTGSARLPSIDTITNTRLATAATSATSRIVSHGRVRGGAGATEVETGTAGGADRKEGDRGGGDARGGSDQAFGAAP